MSFNRRLVLLKSKRHLEIFSIRGDRRIEGEGAWKVLTSRTSNYFNNNFFRIMANPGPYIKETMVRDRFQERYCFPVERTQGKRLGLSFVKRFPDIYPIPNVDIKLHSSFIKQTATSPILTYLNIIYFILTIHVQFDDFSAPPGPALFTYVHA